MLYLTMDCIRLQKPAAMCAASRSAGSRAGLADRPSPVGAQKRSRPAESGEGPSHSQKRLCTTSTHFPMPWRPDFQWGAATQVASSGTGEVQDLQVTTCPGGERSQEEEEEKEEEASAEPNTPRQAESGTTVALRLSHSSETSAEAAPVSLASSLATRRPLKQPGMPTELLR